MERLPLTTSLEDVPLSPAASDRLSSAAPETILSRTSSCSSRGSSSRRSSKTTTKRSSRCSSKTTTKRSSRCSSKPTTKRSSRCSSKPSSKRSSRCSSKPSSKRSSRCSSKPSSKRSSRCSSKPSSKRSSRSSSTSHILSCYGFPKEVKQSAAEDAAADSLTPSLAACSIAADTGKKQQQQQQQQQHGTPSRLQSGREGSSLCDIAGLGVNAASATAASSAAAAGDAPAAAGGGAARAAGRLPNDGVYGEFACRDFDDASPYVPIGYLGRGSIGRVYYCREKATGRAFAIKVVAKHPLRGRRRLQRQVLTEKEMLVALSGGGGLSLHPSVVSLYRTYQTSENLYFVLRYAGAVSLRDVLSRLSCAGLRLSPAAARLWAAEAAAALAALRSRHVIHRDIRPENFIVSDGGHLTLVDFDAAIRIPSKQQQQQQQKQQKEQQQQRDRDRERERDRLERSRQRPADADPDADSYSNHSYSSNNKSSSCRSSRSSSRSPACVSTMLSPVCMQRESCEGGRATAPVLSPYAGTAAYAAPELFVSLDAQGEETAAQQRGCGFGTDCWSFGCLLHELLLGFTPFNGESPAALATAVCGAQQLLLPQQLSVAAADLMKRLLQPNEADRLGARDIRELLQHPFFEGLDCMALHHQPLPVDITQYAFAFGGSRATWKSAAAAAAVAAAAARNAYTNTERDESLGDAEAPAAAAAAAAADAAAAAITSAVLDAELTPSVGSRFSPLKSAAGQVAKACVSCGSSTTEESGTLRSAVSGSCNEPRLFEGSAAFRRLCAGGGADAEPDAAQHDAPKHHEQQQQEQQQQEPLHQEQQEPQQEQQEQQQHQQKQQQLKDQGQQQQEQQQQQQQEQQQEQKEKQKQELHAKAFEEPRSACPCTMTEPVLGWGPPLQLQPISSADYSELSLEDSAAAAAAAAAVAARPRAAAAAATAAAAGGGNGGREFVGQTASRDSWPFRGISRFRESLQGPRRFAAETPGVPVCAALWLHKGESLRHHGMLFRMRERRSVCERLFSWLVRGEHKRRNCQLQPQRCLALLTDAGRLLLLDPSGKTLKKTVLLAMDGEIYTEGKDMLIYSSAESGSYLLFASDGDTASAWARFLALSIDELRQKAVNVRPTAEGEHRPVGAEEEKSEREESPPQPPLRLMTSPVGGCRTESSDFCLSSLGDWPAQQGEASGKAGLGGTEGASIPTAATPTARAYADQSSSNLLANMTSRTLIRLQETPRCHTGSTRIPHTRAADGHHIRQLHSEGPPGRPPGHHPSGIHAYPL